MNSDPHDAAPRLAEFEKDPATERTLVAVNEILASATLPPVAGDVPPERLALVYVVGAPRSGTTLLHQLIARHLDVAYIDNVVARFWRRPSVGVALSKALLSRRSFELRSKHGTTDEPAGPHEFGYFWRLWLRLDEATTHHLTDDEQERVDKTGLKRALEDEILGPFGKAVVFKNVICGFHAGMLTAVHPRSLFVHVTRDAEQVARSILQARLERYGSFEAWWSLKPSTYPFSGVTSAAAQVVAQVNDSRREIADELARDGVCAIEIRYESVCADPVGAMNLIREAVGGVGADVPALQGPIEPLRASPGPRLPDDVEQAVRVALAG